RILQARGRGLTIIFTRTKRTAASVARDLSGRGFATAELHGDLGQGAREQAMRAFRKGKVDVLVATDVAARGIDVDDVTHVINYQCPEDEKTYLHRIGRTGRAGASGTAVTFVDWDDVPRWSLISNALGLGVPDPLETYHTSPHLYTDLDIPTDVTGRLPRSKRTRPGLEAEEFVDVSGKGERGRRRRGGRNRNGGRGAKGGTRRSRSRGRGQGRDGESHGQGKKRQRRRIRKNHND
ncbi:MAG TPA: ATP-dependent helicase, partial [Actinomyces sp.]|nr:ATP-dependent helicase [Actinomyces sp.]